MAALAESRPDVKVHVVPADLSSDEGIDSIAELCASQPLTMLVNNAGVAHYMPLADLPADTARELTQCRGSEPAARVPLPG
jgi:short-subunit dehydrogenase